eukprot:3775528-Rhodomonas_salina.1
MFPSWVWAFHPGSDPRDSHASARSPHPSPHTSPGDGVTWRSNSNAAIVTALEPPMTFGRHLTGPPASCSLRTRRHSHRSQAQASSTRLPEAVQELAVMT